MHKSFFTRYISRLVNILNKLKFNQKSIQYKLLSTYIFVNIVPLIIVAVISYQVSSNAIYREVEKNNIQLLEEISRNISSYIQDINKLSLTYVSKVLYKSINSMESLNRKLDLNDTEVLENLMQMNEFINTTFSSSRDFMSIRLFSGKGDFLSCAFDMKNYKLYSYNSAEEAAWREKMKENRAGSLIFDIHQLDLNGEYSFVASMPAINPHTMTRYGYISFDKDFISFANIFRQFEQREGSTVQVIRSDGTLLYHPNMALIGQKADDEYIRVLSAEPKGNLIKDIHGKRMMICYNRLPGYDLTVVGSIPLNVLIKYIHPLRNITVITCLLSLILVAALSMILSFYIARPIKKLSNLMKQVENGSLNVAINPIHSEDEIGHLSKSFNSMIHKINQLIKSGYEVELHRKDAELKALLMQINPHFLYNTLEVISGIADCEGVEKISDITQSLSRMLRYNIDLRSEKVRIKDELGNCRNFFLILKSRFEDNLVLEEEIDPQTEKYVIVKQVLQPLVENAIKHGVEKKIGKGQIKLVMLKVDDSITIKIEDNGVGFSEEKLREFEKFTQTISSSFYDSTATKSLGLKNVYARLRIFFGDKLEFKINSTVNVGTTILITIPSIEYKD